MPVSPRISVLATHQKILGGKEMIFIICGAMAAVAIGGIVVTLAGIATHKIAV